MALLAKMPPKLRSDLPVAMKTTARCQTWCCLRYPLPSWIKYCCGPSSLLARYYPDALVFLKIVSLSFWWHLKLKVAKSAIKITKQPTSRDDDNSKMQNTCLMLHTASAAVVCQVLRPVIAAGYIYIYIIQMRSYSKNVYSRSFWWHFGT